MKCDGALLVGDPDVQQKDVEKTKVSKHELKGYEHPNNVCCHLNITPIKPWPWPRLYWEDFPRDFESRLKKSAHGQPQKL